MDTPSRTPLYAMSDEQLLWYAEGEVGSNAQQQLAQELLLERLGDELEHRKVPVLETVHAHA